MQKYSHKHKEEILMTVVALVSVTVYLKLVFITAFPPKNCIFPLLQQAPQLVLVH